MRLFSPLPRVALFAAGLLLVAGCERGLPPSVQEIEGPEWVAAGQVVTCSTLVRTPDYEDVSVRFAWGDGDTSEWIASPWRHARAAHAWADTGHFIIKAQARDASGRLSEWLGGLLLVSLDSSVVKWVTNVGPVGATCPAVGPEGNIYVMTDDHLVALDSTGRQLWRNYGFGGSRSPVVGDDGSIYVLSSHLAMLDPDGTRRRVDTLVDGDYLDAPALGPDGAIYATRDDTLVCLNSDGTLRWDYDAPGYAEGSPAIGTDSSICWVVNAPSDSPSVLVLRPDGSLKWSACVYDASWVSAGPQGSFIVSSGLDCYLFDAQGHAIWESGSFGAEVTGPAVVAPGSVLLLPSRSGLLRREPDGTGERKHQTWRFGMSVLVDAAGNGYAGADTSGNEWASDYAIVLFDSTVEGHRSIPVGGQILGAPGVSPDGTVYIGTREGYLYALKGAPGLAATPWPKYGHDSRNTSCAAGH